MPTQRKTVTREIDGRLQEHFPLQRAEALVREFHAGHGAGDADGQQAIVVRVVTNIAVLVQVHGFRRGKRRFLPEIERGRFAIRSVVDEESAAANVACRGPGNGHRKRGCDRGVDGIAATLQYVEADLGSNRGRR